MHAQECGYVLAALSGVDHLPGVADLLPGEFRLASEFRPPPPAAFTQARVRPPLSPDLMPDFLVHWSLGLPGGLDRTF